MEQPIRAHVKLSTGFGYVGIIGNLDNNFSFLVDCWREWERKLRKELVYKASRKMGGN